MSSPLPPEAEERIDRIMEQVRKELEDILRWSYDRDDEGAPMAAEIEKKISEWIRRLGRDAQWLAMGCLDLYRRKGREKCPCCGEPIYWTRYERKNCMSTLGMFQIERAYYHHGPCHCGWVPLDERLQWGRSELSPLAEEMVAYLGGFMPFERVSHYLKSYLGLEISPDTVNNATVRVGQALRQQQEAARQKAWVEGEVPGYEGDKPPKRLYVSADGIKHLEPDGQGREIKVAAIYETEERATADGEVEIHALNTEYVVASKPAALAQASYVAASKRGLHEAKERVVLGDGAAWIWNQLAPVLRVPDCTEIVDFFHATEYVWRAGESAYGSGSPRTQDWAGQTCHRLKHEGPEPVRKDIAALPVPRTQPPEAITDALTYFENQAPRMDYPTYRREGLQIGSGSAESAVQRVVGARINQPGMRWRHDRAENVAHVRAAILSADRWPQFWATYRPPTAHTRHRTCASPT
jgi:hypothetical protein